MGKSKTRHFWNQLKKRNVVRNAVFYLLAGLVALPLIRLLVRDIGVPPESFSVLLTLFLLGFPVALVLFWFFEVTPRGVRRDTANHIENHLKIEDLSAFPSIAVLPFEDTSEKQNQAYFGEGLAEEILNILCRSASLRVVSRAASFQFAEKPADCAVIGGKLAVRSVLDGSAHVTRDGYHVSARLLDTADGRQIWSSRYERPLVKIFELEKEIAAEVAAALGAEMKPVGDIVARKHLNPKAYEFLLRGLSYFARNNIQDNTYARQMLKQAIEIEPRFGRAWAGIAYTHGYEYMYFNASNVNMEEAKSASVTALELAPDLSVSHVAAGIAHCMSHEYKEAEASFTRAIELDPRNFHAWYFFGRAKVHEGDLRRALKLFDRAARVRPEDFQSVLLQAQLYTSLNRKDKAIAVTREGIERVRAALALNPDDNRALNMGAFALMRLGQREEASEWMTASMQNAPADSIIQYNGACFFSLAGDVEHALDCLENCLIKVGNINREWLEHDSDMDNIRNHPRFEEIVSNFPE